jgi:membrane-associated protease RseP (regulator of RpoE activity)
MSNETRFDRLANEVVSGGTQRDADPAPTPAMKYGGIAGWILLFVLLWFHSPWDDVFVFGILLSVVLHEFGHFYTARKSGMKATQFFVGFGPRVWSFHRNGVEYGLRVLPLGGFVKIIGMTNVDEIPAEDEAVTYRQASFPRRMWVITAGSVMHMIIAIVLIVGVYGISGRFQESGHVTVRSVSAGSPASTAGLQPHDVVTAVDGVSTPTAEQFRTILAATAPHTTVHLDVLRGSSHLTLAATLVQSPSAKPGEVRGFLGVSSDSFDRVKVGVGSALVQGPKDLVVGVGRSVVGILKVNNPVNVFGHLTGSNTDATSRPGTIVGATRVSKTVGTLDGWAGMLEFLASLNVTLGVLNMFPLIPLDGGHAAVAIYERVRSRKNRRYFADFSKLMPVAAACIMLLAFMFLTGMYLDIAKP